MNVTTTFYSQILRFKAVFYVKLVQVGSSVFHQEWWAEILRAGQAAQCRPP